VASALAHELNVAGLEAQASEASGALSPEDYDAFVIGSPLYGGTWLAGAGMFAAAMAERMKGKPVAMFSVGTLMLKSPERGKVEHRDFIAKLGEVAPTLNVVADTLFSGYFDRANLPWFLRMIDRIAPTPQGDHRNWPEIQAWGKSVAARFKG
jgi:menaquinone-dependent protoporphyrinogen oxidase